MVYTSLNTELYTTKDKQIGVLVHKQSKMVIASFHNGIPVQRIGSVSLFMAQLAYNNHDDWLEYDYSHVLRMTKMIGQVYNWRNF